MENTEIATEEQLQQIAEALKPAVDALIEALKPVVEKLVEAFKNIIESEPVKSMLDTLRELAELDAKLNCNNWRKMHGLPLIRRRQKARARKWQRE